MPEKQKARSWKEVQTVIAAISMLISLALCNIMATFERREVKGNTDSLSALMVTPTIAPQNAKPPQVVTSTGSS